jgi:uncharacterized membrane protein YfcA
MIAVSEILLLVSAGVLAGTMNAVAGGGSFASMPALIAVGLPSVAANATSTVALFPGTVSSAWAYRRDMHPVGPMSLKSMAIASVFGGLLGAVLLLVTPTSLFDHVLPWLLLCATLMLAFGQRLRVLLAQRGHHVGPRTAIVAQFLMAIYGGYFGGALGLIMMAMWTLFSDQDVKGVAPARVLLGSASNAAAVVCFIIAGAVRWPQALSLLVGAVIGGYGGAHVGKRLPEPLVRAAILTITSVTTVAFFIRAYS